MTCKVCGPQDVPVQTNSSRHLTDATNRQLFKLEEGRRINFDVSMYILDDVAVQHALHLLSLFDILNTFFWITWSFLGLPLAPSSWGPTIHLMCDCVLCVHTSSEPQPYTHLRMHTYTHVLSCKSVCVRVCLLPRPSFTVAHFDQ